MAKACKNVMVDGRMVEKEVEEYAAFEFDRFGDMTLPASLEDDERYKAYDSDGKRLACPSFEDWQYHVNDCTHFGGQRGQLLYELGIFNDWVWKDRKGRRVYVSTDANPWENKIDENGNLVRQKLPNEDESFFEYEGNFLVHAKGFDDTEAWFEYSDGLLVHEKSKKRDGEGTPCLQEVFYEYNAEENLIRKQSKTKYDSEDEKDLDEYDGKGHLIHCKNEHEGGDGYRSLETWREYDGNGRLVWEKESFYSKDSEGEVSESVSEKHYTYECDDSGNVISRKCEKTGDSGEETDVVLYEYDAKGRRVRQKYPNSEYIYEYDAAGNLIYEEKIGGYINICEYDMEGRVVYMKEVKEDSEQERRWDSSGLLVYEKSSIENSNQWYEKSWEWDEEGKIRSEKTNYSPSGIMEEFRWDNLGRVVYFETPRLQKWIDYDEEKGLVHIHGHKQNFTHGVELVTTMGGEVISFREGGKFQEFDQAGNLIRYNDGKTDEWYEYDFYDDGSLKRKVCLREA